jgi:hypothetical protein
MHRANVAPACALLVVAATVPVTGYYLHWRANKAAYERLDAELTIARSSGIPVNAQDLRQAVRKRLNLDEKGVSEADNAAPIYRELAATLPKFSTGDPRSDGALLPELQRRPTPPMLRKASAVLKQFDKHFPKIERAAARRVAFFDRPWEEGVAMLQMEYATMKRVAKLLACRSIVRAHRGDVEGALKDIQRMDAIARHVWSEPDLIAFLAGNSIELIAFRAVADSVEAARRDPAKLSAIARMLEGMAQCPNLGWFLGRPMVSWRLICYFDWAVGDATGRMPYRLSGDPNQTILDVRGTRYWRRAIEELYAHEKDPAAIPSVGRRFDHGASVLSIPGSRGVGEAPLLSPSSEAFVKLIAIRRSAIMVVTVLGREASGEERIRDLARLGPNSIDP